MAKTCCAARHRTKWQTRLPVENVRKSKLQSASHEDQNVPQRGIRDLSKIRILAGLLWRYSDWSALAQFDFHAERPRSRRTQFEMGGFLLEPRVEENCRLS